MSARVLLVDDEVVARELLAKELTSAGFDVAEASDGREGLGLFEELDPDIVVTDKDMPHRSGLDLLAAIRERSDAPVIVLTAFGSVDSAVKAMKAGALDYIRSDSVEPSEIVGIVRGAVGRVPKHDIESRIASAFPGSSPVAVGIRNRLSVFAPLTSPVFVQGAAGTNKAEIVGALHRAGSSRDGPLIEVHASELRPQMLRSDAAAIHIHGAETLPHTLHPACALAIDDERGPRIFASSAVALDDTGLERGLAAKLHPFVIEMPLLCDHPIDLASIAATSLAGIGAAIDREGLDLSPEALARLQSERWPGNEAELHAVLVRAAILGRERRIELEAIERALDEALASVARIRELGRSHERERLIAALREADGVISRASRILQLSRPAVYRLMDKHGLERERRS